MNRIKTRLTVHLRYRVLLLLTVLVGGWNKPALAQTTLSFGYSTNLGLAGKLKYVHGANVMLKRPISSKVALGVSVRFIQNPIVPNTEKAERLWGIVVEGFGIDWRHLPITGLVEYQLTKKKVNPYIGLESGLFINHFRSSPDKTSLRRNVSFGMIPKLGVRTTLGKLGVFTEGLYTWQTINQVEHEFGRAAMKRGYVVANFGLTFTL